MKLRPYTRKTFARLRPSSPRARRLTQALEKEIDAALSAVTTTSIRRILKELRAQGFELRQQTEPGVWADRSLDPPLVVRLGWAGTTSVRLADAFTEQLLGWSRTTDLNDDPHETLEALLARLEEREQRQGTEALAVAERHVLRVHAFELAMGSGGVESFLWDAAGDHARETVPALQAVGANETAHRLDRLFARLPRAAWSADQDRRWRALERLSVTDRRAVALFDRWFHRQTEGELTPMMLRHLERGSVPSLRRR